MFPKTRTGLYAKIASTAGILLALGGTAYADTIVTSADIQDGTIRNRDVHLSTLTGGAILNGSIHLGDLAPDARSAAFAAYHDASVAVSNETSVLTLSVPKPGKYAIDAKTNFDNSSASTWFGHCTLHAAGDSDFVVEVLDPHTDATVGTQIVHVFSAPGTAELLCDASGGVGSVSHTKITAVEVDSLTNTAS